MRVGHLQKGTVTFFGLCLFKSNKEHTKCFEGWSSEDFFVFGNLYKTEDSSHYERSPSLEEVHYFLRIQRII